jgi:hypothetical protein
MNTMTTQQRGKFDLSLTLDEAILVRDALVEMKQLLKAATSERGLKLCKLAAAIGNELNDKIQRTH